jgi:adenylate cyclase class IV
MKRTARQMPQDEVRFLRAECIILLPDQTTRSPEPMEAPMPCSIEIKARVPDLQRLRTAVEALSDTPAEVLDQEDVFFQAPQGRLKLRIQGDRQGELILYHREDAPGPRPSRYLIAPTSDPSALQAILTSVLGAIGVVRKRRRLYLIGQTRVHLDEVEGLG